MRIGVSELNVSPIWRVLRRLWSSTIGTICAGAPPYRLNTRCPSSEKAYNRPDSSSCSDASRAGHHRSAKVLSLVDDDGIEPLSIRLIERGLHHLSGQPVLPVGAVVIAALRRPQDRPSPWNVPM